LAGGAGGLLCRAVLLFCEENPLLNDDDVPECVVDPAIAGTFPARDRQTINNSADRNGFMMCFHKELNEKQHSAARRRLHR
jgi:hypothetical protein